MLKVGDKITIRFSKKLAQKGNSQLVNQTGIVTRLVFSNGKLKGVYADVKVMRWNRNYYIPTDSIGGCNEINKLRVLSILKSSIL